MKLLLLLIVGISFAPSATAQQIYKCSNAKGVSAYQQTPCATQAKTESIRAFTPVPDAPNDYGQYSPREVQQRPPPAQAMPSRQTTSPTRPAPDDVASGYVRCVRDNGSSYLRKGNSCPIRYEPAQQRAGMVTDVTTGQQTFMVPGGGNGMIDPTTEERHELISPKPMQQVHDTAQPVSQDEACSEARANRSRALSDPNRTIDRIRAAEARYGKLCGS